MPEVGINLSPPIYFIGQYAFIDRMRENQAWSTSDLPGSTAAPITFDSEGWPVGLPEGARTVWTVVSLDPVGLDTTDRYVVLYDGVGSVAVLGGTTVLTEPGRTVFDYTLVSEADAQGAQFNVLASDPTDPIRNIRVIREDQLGLYEQGQVFSPDFLEKTDQLGTLRFMDWGRTNTNPIVEWKDRPLPTDATYDGPAGVPIELMVALCNETGQDMWYTMPTRANDDYVAQALTYIRDNLNPELRLHVEYSNEMWNFGFEQAHYAARQAADLWGTDANGDGTIDPYTYGEGVTNGHVQYYGYRAAQIARIADDVFGAQADTRLINVLTSQTHYEGLEAYVLEGVARAGLGEPGALFDELAITGYFTGGFGNEVSWATLQQWAGEGEAGLAKAFRQLQYGDIVPAELALEDLAATYAYWAKQADALGLSLVAYEGGQHIVPINAPAEMRDQIIEFFTRIQDDPRMGTLYTRNIEMFAQAGGDLFAGYNNVGQPSIHGGWGALQSIYDEGSPRWDAYVDAMLQWERAKIVEWNGTNGGDFRRVTAGGDWKLAGKLGDDRLIGANGRDMVDGGGGDDFLYGGANVDLVTGGAGHDTLRGEIGNDKLYGGIGNDRVDGGSGFDLMVGGGGNDTYWVDARLDTIVELAGEGQDRVYSDVDYQLADHLERLYLRENARRGVGNAGDNVIEGNARANALIGGGGDDTLLGEAGEDSLEGGAGDDTLRGDDGADRLMGGLGADRLDGGAGRDVMIGGAGDDHYWFDTPQETVVELYDEGLDTIYVKVNITLPDKVERLYLSGDARRAIGNADDNMIAGSEGDDVLAGLAGEDELVGGLGADWLAGGVGKDRLYGGLGDDVLAGGDDLDLLIGGAGADRFVFGADALSADKAQADRIRDFRRVEGDTIDLSQIDADTTSDGDQAFALIGARGFSGVAGELRYASFGSGSYLFGDTNGDAKVDFAIWAKGVERFVLDDFAL